MRTEKRQHSYFELFIISLLVLIASLQAFEWSLAGVIPVFHAVTLVSLYLFLRLISGRLRPFIGIGIFAVSTVLLLTEIAIHQITGLHLNKFVLSIMFQPDTDNQTGISGPFLFAGIAVILYVFIWLGRRYAKPTFTLKGRLLIATGLVSISLSQLTFGALFFHGQSDAMEVKRELPFFRVVPSYYTRKFFGMFWDQTRDTPFSYKPQNFAREKKAAITAPSFSRKQNILWIVTDSLRSSDIKINPGLTPNLNRFFRQDYISYDHLATANCTHFSFYSMFTGRLATSFGSARRRGGAPSLFKAFEANGYQTSTSEATSLDWYDVSSIILAPDTKRKSWTEDTDSLRNDSKVTETTITALKQYAADKQPFFHLAYYYGNHFPYLSEEKDKNLSLKERYLASIRSFDRQTGKILDFMRTSPLLEDTIIIITSDHGEELREDGIMGHAGRLSDEQVYVPLWIKGLPDAYQKGIQSHIDLPGTITAFMEETPPQEGKAPVILTNCDYDFPKAFAVLRGQNRNDFLYDSGYLSPIKNRDDPAKKKQQIEDANLLLEIIKNAEN